MTVKTSTTYPIGKLPQGLLDHRSIIDELHKASLTYSTYEDFARAIGLSVAYTTQVLNGRVPVSGTVLAYLGATRAMVYELTDLECPYVAQAEREFIRRGREYEDARGMLAARIAEDAGRVLPADAYDRRGEARDLAIAQARATLVATKPRSKRSRFIAMNPVEARPAPNRRNTMSLDAVAALADREEPPTGAELKRAFGRLRQVMNPNSRVTDASRELALSLFDRMRRHAPNVPAMTQKRVAGEATYPRKAQPPTLKEGQMRRQKSLLLAAMASGKIVTVTEDQPVRMAAAEDLLVDGIAEKVDDAQRRVAAGQLRAGETTRRVRRVLRIVMGDVRI